MASVFSYYVVGDLTVGKPELVEFSETETVEAAIEAIGDDIGGAIPVWRKKFVKGVTENAEMRQKRFVGILNSLNIVGFLAREESLADKEKAMDTPVSEVVVRDASLLKVIDPGTSLIDALEMMKQGVKLLLVPKSKVWRGTSKKFSVIYHGKWLRNSSYDSLAISRNSSYDSLAAAAAAASRPSSSSTTVVPDKYHCLSREDVIRFVIGCLGALAPLPLSSISTLGIINPNYRFVEAACSAMDATRKLPRDPCAVAVVELTPDSQRKIIGDISACKLWKCDYLGASWALANLSAGQFVKGVEDNPSSRVLSGLPDNAVRGNSDLNNGNNRNKPRKLSSRSKGLLNNPGNPNYGVGRSMYRGRSAPLTCKVTSSLAAVMAQMLSHRATHVWVTEAENEDNLVGVVSYVDILVAVTKPLATPVPEAINNLEESRKLHFSSYHIA